MSTSAKTAVRGTARVTAGGNVADYGSSVHRHDAGPPACASARQRGIARINISMYPGAKIGVLGLNGSGKSTLLRILAGEDDGYSGEVRVTPGFSVGYLPQEPQLDESKDVLGN